MAESIVIVSAVRTPIGGMLGDFSGLAAHQPHRRVDGHEPRARDEREAGEVQDEDAGAGVVQPAEALFAKP